MLFYQDRLFLLVLLTLPGFFSVLGELQQVGGVWYGPSVTHARCLSVILLALLVRHFYFGIWQVGILWRSSRLSVRVTRCLLLISLGHTGHITQAQWSLRAKAFLEFLLRFLTILSPEAASDVLARR